MGTVSTPPVSCGGFPPDRYDRYVLGLLSGEERAQVDRQIEQQCPACTKGVQRSMNLWLVFANSLEQKEPAADFRGRLVRIAELSNRVLTIPKRNKRVREPAILISSLVAGGLIILTLMIFTWIASRQSAIMDLARGNNELHLLTGQLTDAETQVKLLQERVHDLEKKQGSGGPSPLVQQKALQDTLSRAQASVQQYRSILARESQKTVDNTVLVSALNSPGTRLLAFKGQEGEQTSAYALVEASQVVFVAARLAPPPEHEQYQLWLVRKDENPVVSLGVFYPNEDKAAVLTYSEDKTAIANLLGLMVTEEPSNGVSTPTGARVMETANLPK